MLAGNMFAFWPFGSSSSSSRKSEQASHVSGEKDAVTKKFHMLIPDKKTEQELLRLFTLKRMLDEDIRVLRRLLNDRKAKLDKYQENMRKEFLIVPEAQYEYDDRDRTIYRIDVESNGKGQTNVTSRTGLAGTEDKRDSSVELKKKRVFHKKLTEDEEKRFGELVVGRRQLLEQVRALESLLVEQERSLENTTKVLTKTYSLKEGCYYDYDAKTMTLYEIIPPTNSISSTSSTR